MKIFYILCYAPYFMLCSLPSKKTKCPKPPLFSTSSLLNLYTSNTYTLSLRTPELIHPKELHTCKKILDTQVLDTPHYCTYTPNGLIHSTKYEILIRTYTLGNNWYYSLLNKKNKLMLDKKYLVLPLSYFHWIKTKQARFLSFFISARKNKKLPLYVWACFNSCQQASHSKRKLLHQFTPRLEIIHSPIPDKCTFHVMGQ